MYDLYPELVFYDILYKSNCGLFVFQGRIILSLPSIEVLAEAAAAPNRRGAVLHVLETTVLGWIKQIKVHYSYFSVLPMSLKIMAPTVFRLEQTNQSRKLLS